MESNNQRIAKNTLYLYLRMGIGVLVSLYTSRVVLRQLGEVDYGIYGVVGGLIVLFSMLQTTMAGSTQRFLTIDLGQRDLKQMNITFNTSMHIHAIIAVIFILLAEPIGLWFLNHKMQIPIERMFAAHVVFQCSISTAALVFMTVPYSALLIAHERMSAYALITILEIVLRLCVAVILTYISADKLIFYAIMMAIIPIVSIVIYWTYCHVYFPVSRLKKIFSPDTFKQMLSFAGWSLWGNTSAILANQGVNVLLNMFFGPVVNTARGIAVQVQSVIVQFSSNFQTAVNPQITKNYAAGEKTVMHALIIRSAKITLYLLLIIAVPLLVNISEILHLWLGDYPQYTVAFAKLIIVTSILDAVSRPIITGVNATGKIRLYQIIVGGVLLLTLPVSYVVLKLGGNPISAFWVNLVVIALAMGVRLCMARPLIHLSVRAFVVKVLLRGVIVSAIAYAAVALSKIYIVSSGWIVILNIALGCLVTMVISFYVGLDRSEREFVLTMARNVVTKIRHH